MGVKSIKDAYLIGHIVQRTSEGICIGSPYVHDIIVIGEDGQLLRVWGRDRKDGDLANYLMQLERDAASGRLKQLFHEEDVFTGPLTDVWIVEKSRMVKKQCEYFGWPNTTTDGRLMYENTAFKVREEARQKLLNETFYGLRYAGRSFVDNNAKAFAIYMKAYAFLFKKLWSYIRARLILK